MRSLLSASLSMQRSFPQSAYPLEWICKLHLEYACEALDFRSEELEGDRYVHIQADIAGLSLGWV